jgi:hypothetical protein
VCKYLLVKAGRDRDADRFHYQEYIKGKYEKRQARIEESLSLFQGLSIVLKVLFSKPTLVRI